MTSIVARFMLTWVRGAYLDALRVARAAGVPNGELVGDVCALALQAGDVLDTCDKRACRTTP